MEGDDPVLMGAIRPDARDTGRATATMAIVAVLKSARLSAAGVNLARFRRGHWLLGPRSMGWRGCSASGASIRQPTSSASSGRRRGREARSGPPRPRQHRTSVPWSPPSPRGHRRRHSVGDGTDCGHSWRRLDGCRSGDPRETSGFCRGSPDFPGLPVATPRRPAVGHRYGLEQEAHARARAGRQVARRPEESPPLLDRSPRGAGEAASTTDLRVLPGSIPRGLGRDGREVGRDPHGLRRQPGRRGREPRRRWRRVIRTPGPRANRLRRREGPHPNVQGQDNGGYVTELSTQRTQRELRLWATRCSGIDRSSGWSPASPGC